MMGGVYFDVAGCFAIVALNLAAKRFWLGILWDTLGFENSHILLVQSLVNLDSVCFIR